jgi:predicted nuclease with TOPRIM domain
MKERDIIKLKEQIEEAAHEAAALTGERTAVLNQMKETYKVSDIDSLKKKKTQLEKEILKLIDQLDENVSKLEELLENEL